MVEYRVEQHLEALKDRLGALGFVTAKDTTAEQGLRNDEPRAPVTDGGVTSSESGPGATRTRDLLLRRQALYPAELRARTSVSGKR